MAESFVGGEMIAQLGIKVANDPDAQRCVHVAFLYYNPLASVQCSDLPQLGIQTVPQPVAQEINREHREQHGQTWEERDPPGSRQKATAVGDHQAPGWIGWWYADTQETQRALEENDITNLD